MFRLRASQSVRYYYSRKMSNNIENEAEAFIHSYAAHFASPDANSTERIPDVAKKIAAYFRPGVTLFSNGKILKVDVSHCTAPRIRRK